MINGRFVSKWLFYYSLVLLAKCQSNLDTDAIQVHYLDADSVVDYEPKFHRGFFENDLRTYCYRGNPKTIGRYFETIELLLQIDGLDFTQYDGVTPEEVRDHHSEKQSLFSFNLLSQKKTRLQLSPFEQQCIGIETIEPYRVKLHRVGIDLWRVIQLVVAVLLFVAADRLSLNPLFYYITGVLLGICLSFMIVIWLLGKLIPRRSMMYGVLVGGWAVGFYIIQLLWENLQLIVLTYRTYVFWYILTTGVLSFFICYRLGPPKNKRSKNIVKWVVQLISLLLIYNSSHFEEAAIGLIILVTLYNYFPRVLMYKARGMYLRRFPPKRRLLTNEEYYLEGVRETAKALDSLRTFASSPECKQWKVMSNLSDPLRFAAFVEGASHLSDEDILKYECSKSDDDDDHNISTDDQEENPKQSNVQHRLLLRQNIKQSRKSFTPNRKLALEPEELSDDEQSNEAADNDDEIASPTYRTREASYRSSSARQMPNEIAKISRPSPFSVFKRSGSAQRVESRAARMVSSAQRRKRNVDNTMSTRSYEEQEYSGDSQN